MEGEPGEMPVGKLYGLPFPPPRFPYRQTSDQLKPAKASAIAQFV
jgi:hypothetical protein